MKLSVLLSAVILAFAFVGGRAVAAKAYSRVFKEYFERDLPETQVPVPESIQKDMYQIACTFLGRVYPDIDKDWMRKECGKALLKDRYGLLRLHDPWPPMVRIRVKGTLQMDVSFPWGDVVQLAALCPPPGVVLKVLEKPLTVDQTEVRARRVLDRLVGGPERARGFEATESGEAQRNYDYFRFVEFARSPGRSSVTGLYVHVRRPDGFIQRCNWSTLRLRPTVPYNEAARMAKAIPTGGTGPGEIYLETRYRGGAGTLVWIFEVPPSPGGSSLYETWWDATTGDLLYSMVLHGGTPEKPYQNPKYFTEVNDEVIKRNIDMLIKDRVAELEKKRDEQGAGKPPPAK